MRAYPKSRSTRPSVKMDRAQLCAHKWVIVRREADEGRLKS